VVKVAVTGGGGYVGRALVRRLLASGHSVVALLRRPLDFGPQERFQAVHGDVRDPRALDSLIAGAGAVAHLAAYVHRPAGRADEQRECFAINLDGTRAVIEAIERAGLGARLVFVSTVAVYGGAFTDASEDAPCAPASPYASSKLAAEAAVRDAFSRGALSGLVLRPAMVFGPGAPGNLAKLRRVIEGGLSPRIAGGNNQKSLVHVDDLVDVLALALTRPAPQRLYNVAADPSLTMRAINEALSGGRRTWPLPVPGPVASAAVRTLELAGRSGARRLAELARTLDTFRTNATVDTARVRRDFAVRFRPTDQALRDLAARP
jgi:nucleoside-diphosphate-sugar epimerase